MCNVDLMLRTKRTMRLIALLIMWLGALSACVNPASSQRLRITNVGSEGIHGLSVLFPGPTADSQAIRVQFGDVPAGTTTEYLDVPSGVYRYAAYEYTLDSRVIQQPVVDWVGESPINGREFTYRIELDAEKPAGVQIRLIEVLVDRR